MSRKRLKKVKKPLVHSTLENVPVKKRVSVLQKYLYYGGWISSEEVMIKRYEFDNRKLGLLSLKNKNCYCCGKPAEHRHHIIPLCKGGQNVKENLVALCKFCHKKMDVLQSHPEFRKRYLGWKPDNTPRIRYPKPSLSSFSGVLAA